MNSLIGWRCAIHFNLPPSDWPVEGSPAWATVSDVAMPLIELWTHGRTVWVNANDIRTIRAVEPDKELIAVWRLEEFTGKRTRPVLALRPL